MDLEGLFQDVDNQTESNQSKSLLQAKSPLFYFSKETVSFMEMAKELPKDSREQMIEYVLEKTIQAFRKMSQSFSFDSKSKKYLKIIYQGLLKEILEGKYSLKDLSDDHYNKLKSWLSLTNPFALKL